MTTRYGHFKVATHLYLTGWSQLYEYTSDSLCIDFCRPPHPQLLYPVSTPLCPDAWAAALASHPDRAFARYICNGLRFGFRIGFQYGAPLKSASFNNYAHSNTTPNGSNELPPRRTIPWENARPLPLTTWPSSLPHK